MAFTALILFVCICAHRDFAKCENQELMDTVLVELGGSLTLNCTYNCSSGFVRACWTPQDEKCVPGVSNREDFCAVSLPLQNISSKDLKKYICYSEISDATPIQRKEERVVLLKLKDPTCCESHTATHRTETTKSETKDLSVTEKEKPGMNDGMEVLAAVTVPVALVLAVLAVYLCHNRGRQGCNCKDRQPPVNIPKSTQALPLIKGPTSKQSERVTLRIPTPEIEGDPEVPYADIIISVRGASTPDLSQALYLNSTNLNERWGATPGTHLQAARSADVLHVPRQDVSRKTSSSSEYAVIMYA